MWWHASGKPIWYSIPESDYLVYDVAQRCGMRVCEWKNVMQFMFVVIIYSFTRSHVGLMYNSSVRRDTHRTNGDIFSLVCVYECVQNSHPVYPLGSFFFSEVSTSTSEPGQISSFVVVVDVNFLTLFLSCSFFHTRPLSIGWHCTDFNWIFMNEWEHKHLNGHCSVEKYRIKILGK